MHWSESTHFIPVYFYFWNLTEQLAGLIYWELSIGWSFSSESVSILRSWDSSRLNTNWIVFNAPETLSLIKGENWSMAAAVAVAPMDQGDASQCLSYFCQITALCFPCRFLTFFCQILDFSEFTDWELPLSPHCSYVYELKVGRQCRHPWIWIRAWNEG